MSGIISRRRFLISTGAALAAASLGTRALAGDDRSRVILIRDQAVMDKDGKIDTRTLERMIDQAVLTLFDASSPGAAWKKIIKPADVVGIKSNGWRSLPTPPEVEIILKTRVLEAGVAEDKISIDDKTVLRNPVFAKATVLINARPMRAHHWSGVGGCLKNYIMFAPKPSDLHPNSCEDLGSVWNLPAVKGKTRLNVLVMLTPQFNCLGPHHFDREFLWQYKGILVGTDPVALDAVGLKIFDAKRKLYFKEDSPIRQARNHIRAAEEKHRVGIANPEKIDLVKLGWKDDVLI